MQRVVHQIIAYQATAHDGEYWEQQQVDVMMGTCQKKGRGGAGTQNTTGKFAGTCTSETYTHASQRWQLHNAQQQQHANALQVGDVMSGRLYMGSAIT